MSSLSRQSLRHCLRCGQTWTVTYDRGRLPVVCAACRPAHEADLAAARMRRARARRQELAASEADILAYRVARYADSLLADHPHAARILAEVPYDLAEALVDALKERLWAASSGDRHDRA